jgi:hypothetical protein
MKAKFRRKFSAAERRSECTEKAESYCLLREGLDEEFVVL